MKSLRKHARITTRYSADQMKRLERAAVLESRRRGVAVDESSLSRELTMAGVDRIIAEAVEKVPA